MTAPDFCIHQWSTSELEIATLLHSDERLLTRGQFIDRVQRQLWRAQRSIDSRFVVLLMRLDCYGYVMNEHGPSVAESLVRATAEWIAVGLASRDAISILGGGLIATLVETAIGRDTHEMAALARNALLSAAAEMEPLPVATVSIGVARVTGKYSEADEVIRDARIALEWADREGFGHTVVFHRAMDQASSEAAIAI